MNFKVVNLKRKFKGAKYPATKTSNKTRYEYFISPNKIRQIDDKINEKK